MSLHHRERGFTLIELLVVITIIGLLASTVLASLSVTRSQARDVQRLTQARELMKALEIYRVKYGAYPCSQTAMVCVAGVDDYALKAYLNRPSGTYYEVEPNLRANLYTPTSDPFGYSLMYSVRKNTSGNQADSSSYTIMVGFENPISTATASTTQITVDGNNQGAAIEIPLHYCKITVGTPDSLSEIGIPSDKRFFTAVGKCPIEGIK